MLERRSSCGKLFQHFVSRQFSGQQRRCWNTGLVIETAALLRRCNNASNAIMSCRELETCRKEAQRWAFMGHHAKDLLCRVLGRGKNSIPRKGLDKNSRDCIGSASASIAAGYERVHLTYAEDNELPVLAPCGSSKHHHTATRARHVRNS